MTWGTATLSSVTLPVETVSPGAVFEDEFDYIDIASIDRERKEIVAPKRILVAEAPSRARQLVHENDVLVSTVRPSLNAVAVVPPELSGAIASTGFSVLRPSPGQVLPGFLFFRAISQEFIRSMSAQATGASYPAVSDPIVKGHEIPLPHPREQERITELLQRSRALVHLSMQSEELADAAMPAVFDRLFGDSSRLSDKQSKKPLDQAADFVSGATPSKERSEFWGGDIPWVSAKDMKAPEITDSIDHVSSAALAETNLKLIPEGQVLIVVRGMILAHTVPIRRNTVAVTINQDMKALLPREGFDGWYLRWALQSQHNELLRQVTTAAHGTKRLDTDKLREVTVPVPTPEKLERFARIADRYAAIEAKRRASAVQLETLFQILLTRAFDGRLTAKWREAHARELSQEITHQHRAAAGATRTALQELRP